MQQVKASRKRRQAALVRSAVQAVGFCCWIASLPAASLDSVLERMDAAAGEWAGMRANVEWTRHVSLVDDTTVEAGRIAVRKSRAGEVEMLLAFERPNEYFLAVRGAKVEIYKPKIKTVEEYNLSESKEKLRNALLLGFGTAGSYLREHYDIRLQGEETVAGEPTVRLDLQPKRPRGELNNRRLEMWISMASWQPVRQKVYDVSPGDYRQYSYSAIEVNPTFSAGEFKLKLARGTQRVRPQR